MTQPMQSKISQYTPFLTAVYMTKSYFVVCYSFYVAYLHDIMYRKKG